MSIYSNDMNFVYWSNPDTNFNFNGINGFAYGDYPRSPLLNRFNDFRPYTQPMQPMPLVSNYNNLDINNFDVLGYGGGLGFNGFGLGYGGIGGLGGLGMGGLPYFGNGFIGYF